MSYEANAVLRGAVELGVDSVAMPTTMACTRRRSGWCAGQPTGSGVGF
jgi:hypothetical protein